MKLFQNCQKNLEIMGYVPDQHPFNMKQIQVGLTMLLNIILNFIYLIHVANTPRQYMESCFYTITSILILISFISTVYKMDLIFIFIDKLQIIINEGVKS